MHIVLYVFAAAALVGAVGLSYQGMNEGALLLGDALEAGVRDNGLLLIGGLILAGLGRVLQHMRAIDAGLRRVAKAAEDAARLEE